MTLRLESPLDASCYLLRKAMDGIGTNEDTIARVIGGADKTDVLKIHARFDEKYSRSLSADLESELGGDLKKAVLKWLAPPEFAETVAEPVEELAGERVYIRPAVSFCVRAQPCALCAFVLLRLDS